MVNRQPFDHYTEGCTREICQEIEAIDKERLSLASAMGITSIPTAVEWLELTYGAKGNNLYEALQNNNAYKGIKAPQFTNVDDLVNFRYVLEDVPCNLVPCSCLAKKFGVATPKIDEVIEQANKLFCTNFRDSGRNLQQLGLEDLSPDAIKNIVSSQNDLLVDPKH